MYVFNYLNNFNRKLSKLVKKNIPLRKNIDIALDLLAKNLFEQRLKTHKVMSQYAKMECFSSSVNGDIRIIWIFNGGAIEVIDCIDIGGHSGKNSVY